MTGSTAEPARTNYTEEGADTLLGGAGNDRLIDDEQGGAAVGGNDVLDGGEGDDILQSWYGDDVLHGGAGDDRLSSFYGHDDLYGDEGNDWLSSGFEFEGQGIADTRLIGGLGDDTYWIDGLGDVVVEEDGGGLDTVASFISYTLPDFVENLTLWGTVGIGNGLNNVMKILPGGGSLEGLGGDDDLSGYVGDDTLDGGAGNDQLFGDVGNDRLIGGAGNDTYLINLEDGGDTIEDTAFGAEGNGIRFGEWILQSDLTFVQKSDTLDIQIGNRGGVVRLLNFDPTGVNGSLVVQTLAFADGSTVNLKDLFPPIVNHAPTVATPLVDQTVPEDAPFNLVVPASTFADEDAGDALTLSASLADGTALPSWLSFDAATATFSGTPDDAQVGTFDLKVTATDRENLNVSDVFNLTVTSVNEAPMVAAPLADQQAVEDAPFTFVVPTGSFADVDPGDVLTYSATLAGGAPLPSWLGFDPATGTFTGTPGNADVGTLALTVTATDTGNLAASTGFALLVQNTNDAPTVAAPLADLTASEDAPFTFTVPSNTFTDEDQVHGDVLTYSATLADGSPLPAWLRFNPSSRTLSGTPGAGDAGILQIAVTATDTEVLSATDMFTLAVSGPLPQTIIGTNSNDVLTGGRGDDTLTGLAGNDRLTGGEGQDLLDGGTGIDTMIGGTGNDTYSVDVAGDVVTELANEGTDTVQAAITYTLGSNVENLTLTGTSAINGTGNSLDNVLTGNSAANILTGGAGNDTYIVGAGDTVVENLTNGTDIVVSSVTWTLVSNLENLTLTGTANINGTGNVLNNVLVGNSGANALDGGSGNDTVDGGDGNDSLIGGSGDDTLLGGIGNDQLNSGSGNDVLNGGDGIDSLDGGSGDDRLFGGAGNDTLTGGSGADQFTGSTGNDVLMGGSGNDVYNFLRGDGQDTINDSDLFRWNQDRAVFGATINPLDLVLSRQANDLRIALHGTTDQVTIQNWYTSAPTNQVETIQAGDGEQLLNTQVDQLIQAMAQFTLQSGLTWDQAIDQRPQDVQTVLAASWQ
jgi:Ca2+-binding RTX toxin-like protein